MRRNYAVCGASVFLAVAGCDSENPTADSGTAATEGGSDADGDAASGPNTRPPATTDATDPTDATDATDANPTEPESTTSGPGEDDETAGDDGTTTGAEDADPCATATCRNRSECVADGHVARCDCDGTGYEGDRCADDVNECEGEAATCDNGGVCHNVDGGFVCDCAGTGYDGPTCVSDIDECADGLSCENGASCVNTPGGAMCDCAGTGYEGPVCSDDVDECGESQVGDCENKSACFNTDGSFYCDCEDTGYTGTLCTVDFNECDAGADCGFGKCENTAGSYSCMCDGSGYGGAQCLQDVDECALGARCTDDASCVNGVGTFDCACDEGFVAEAAVCVPEAFLLLQEGFEGGVAGRFEAYTFDDGVGFATAQSVVIAPLFADIEVVEGADMWRADGANTTANPFWPDGDDCGDLTSGACSYIVMERVFVDDYDLIRVVVSLQASAEAVYEADDFVAVELATGAGIAPPGKNNVWLGDYKPLARFEGGWKEASTPLALVTAEDPAGPSVGPALTNVAAETALRDGKPPSPDRFDYTFEARVAGDDEASVRLRFSVGVAEHLGIDDVRIYGVNDDDGSVAPLAD